MNVAKRRATGTYQRRVRRRVSAPRSKPGRVMPVSLRDNAIRRYVRPTNSYTVITRTMVTPVTLPANTASVSFAHRYRLADIPNPTDFDIFDAYKIIRVESRWVPNVNSLGINLYTAVDLNDYTAPTLPSQLLEYSNCDVDVGNSSKVITFYPKLGLKLEPTGTGLMVEGNGWVPTDQKSVQYLGLKYACVVNNGTWATALDVGTWVHKYIIAVKNAK